MIKIQTIFRRSTGQVLHLDAQPVGSGGQGAVYRLSDTPTLLAKLYKSPTHCVGPKLQYMVDHPPRFSRSASRCSVAWPVDLVVNAQDHVIGFLMPNAAGMTSLVDVLTPQTRRMLCPKFNYLYLHRTARNLAEVFNILHQANYVVGDVKEANVLVSHDASITVVDADSFQVCTSGTTFVCPVITPYYTPREFQHKNPATEKRDPSHDLFGLGVLIFQLLMEGVHPFFGVYRGHGEPPDIPTRIERGYFAYSPRSKIIPSPVALPFTVLFPPLQKLFMRCFCDGHTRPQARPTAEEWRHGLLEAENDLAQL